MKTIIIYDTVHGATEAVALEMKKKIKDEVTLVNFENYVGNIDLDYYDNVIIGSGIYVGNMSKKIRRFIDKNYSDIVKKNYGVYICSREEGEAAKKIMANNFEITFLQNAFCAAHLGHGIVLKRLNFFQRLLFKLFFKIKEDYITINKNDIDYFVNMLKNGFKEKLQNKIEQ